MYNVQHGNDLIVDGCQKYVTTKIYTYNTEVQQYIDGQIKNNRLDKPFIGVHVRRGGKYFCFRERNTDGSQL